MLYKYVGSADGNETLKYLSWFVEDATLKATAAIEFNDPTEFKVIFSFDAAEDEKKKRFFELWPKSAEEDCERWLSSRDTAESHDAWMLRRGSLQSHGVLCLTHDPTNFLMWSHYAHSHTGFCIGFDDKLPDDFFPKDCLLYGNVIYQKKPPCVNFYTSNGTDISKALFMHKGETWQYEHEYRLIFLHSGIKRFDKKIIKEIILGCKVGNQVESYARNLIGSNIRVFKMRESFSSYQLEKVELTNDQYF
ncbi:DUF2971 domain-containing protein [Pantoea sp. GD03673]|uniref:DUF2971 domain-containing protein n=1 Tax=Pantoea sp. GD03673 TaxID=2975364 RepID=UPI00244A6692|nr:DUF2971 domain-containing protein [Pantoea sp. GD03673]MDH2069471.1 DUF2971 domain-containing protein [Pantoea sp. GD03673]